MSSQQHDPQLLTRYLLGVLPDAEAERLDELAVTDDELAWRLAETENDLVDAYARGELSGEDLDRFKNHYLSSERRREKVMFAEALRDRIENGRAVSLEQPLTIPVAARRSLPPWALAAAALLLLAPAGYLFLANGRLQQELSTAQSERAALQRRAEGLEKQNAEQRAALAEAGKQPPGGVVQAMLDQLRIVSLILTPQRRGLGKVPTLSMAPETDIVALQLQLESDEFSQYEVAVKSAADNRVLWRSGKLGSVAANGGKIVAASVPASLLSTGHFSVDLTGTTRKGRPELLASYAFRAVVR